MIDTESVPRESTPADPVAEAEAITEAAAQPISVRTRGTVHRRARGVTGRRNRGVPDRRGWHARQAVVREAESITAEAAERYPEVVWGRHLASLTESEREHARKRARIAYTASLPD